MMRRARGPFKRYWQRARHPLDCLRSRMAEHRTCYPGGGGSWSGRTGDGMAWHKSSDKVWTRERQIKGGQWIGPWVHRRTSTL